MFETPKFKEIITVDAQILGTTLSSFQIWRKLI
jgi:hypothetical protein